MSLADATLASANSATSGDPLQAADVSQNDRLSQAADASQNDDAPSDRDPPAGNATSAVQLDSSQTAARLLVILRRRPHFGTAFDRYYQILAIDGQLDEAVNRFLAKGDENPEDVTSHLLAGMIDLHRGHQLKAISALLIAEQRRPEDAVATWYLGRAYVMDGQLELAAETLSRALSRHPPRSDLLEISLELGRVYERLHRPHDAHSVWESLELAFPDDPRVLEQIADVLEGSGQLAAARQRYERLAEHTADRFQRIRFGIAAALLTHQLGNSRDAILRLQTLQQSVLPESWISDELRGRIEQILRDTDDEAAVAEYYRAWLRSHPDDVPAVVRLSAALEALGQWKEARRGLTELLQRAPDRHDVRERLIQLLVRNDEFADALLLHAEWTQREPGNLDQLEAWGQLWLQSASIPLDVRQQKAKEIWQLMLRAASDDPAVYSRVARLMNGAGLKDDALQLFVHAVSLAPQDPLYREQLGEFYWHMDRREEAVSTWMAIAADDRATRDQLLHRVRILSRFGLNEQAVSTMQQVFEQQSLFADHLLFAELLADADQFPRALGQLDRADQLATLPEQRQDVMRQRVNLLRAQGQLSASIQKLQEKLQQQLNQSQQPTASEWQQLALYQEAAGNMADAETSIANAVSLAPESVELWTMAASLFEAQFSFDAAVHANRQLLQLDPGQAFEYLTRIISLHERASRTTVTGDTAEAAHRSRAAKLGELIGMPVRAQSSSPDRPSFHRQAAITSSRQLLQVFPNDPDAARSAAGVQLRLGETEIGLQTLQSAALRFPENRAVQQSLARALAEHGSVAEATDAWWKLFDSADSTEHRETCLESLAELYQRRDATTELVTELERRGETSGRHREMMLLSASVWIFTDHIALARQTLQSLLDQQSDDLELLKRLVQLSQRENNFPLAIDYQRRITDLQPTDENSSSLARLLLEWGSQLERDAQSAAACRAYASALVTDPARFSANFETHLQSFEFADQLPLLGRTLLTIDLTAFQQNAQSLAWLVAELHQQPGMKALSIELGQAILQQYPDRQQAIRDLWRMRDVEIPSVQ